MNLMDWIGQHPQFAQRFDQFMANHPNFNPQPRMPMQFRGVTGGGLPPMQMPQVGTGGNGQAMPMHPFVGTGGPLNPQPTDGGYDGSGINPGGMYTGGNMPQRFPMGTSLRPNRLAGLLGRY